MAYVMFSEDEDIAMRYEGLACFAFDCDKYGGPEGIAHQEFYNEHFVPDPDQNAIKALKQILNSLIAKADGDIKSDLQNVLDSLQTRLEQESAADLIDYVIDIVQEFEEPA